MTDLTKRESDELTIASWGQEDAVDLELFEVPKIMCMQSQSPQIMAGKAMVGEFRTSNTNAKLGNPDEPMRMIPFHLVSKILTRKNNKFVSLEVKTPENSGLPREERIGNDVIQRYLVIQFFVLLPEEIEKGCATPYTMSFQSTSLQAGKKIYTHMKTTLKMQRKPPCASHFIVGAKIQTSEQGGQYFVMDSNIDRDTTQKEIVECFKWYKLVAQGALKVDERRDEEVGSSDPNTVNTTATKQATGKVENVEFDENAF